MTLDEITKMLQTDIALNKDLADIVAKTMSCDLDDQELLKFWDFLVENIHQRDEQSGMEQKARDKKYCEANNIDYKSYKKNYLRVNGGWLVDVINQLSNETVEYLADIPNPLDMSNYPDFELGNLVRCCKGNRWVYDRKGNEVRKVLWGQFRGIWLKEIADLYIYDEFYIDHDLENQWSAKYFHLKKDLVEKKGKITNLLRKNETKGYIFEKKFIPHSIHLKISDCWFYNVMWADENSIPFQTWHPQIMKSLELIKPKS